MNAPDTGKSSRRGFLSAAAAFTAFGTRLKAADPRSEPFWEMVRSQFPLEPGLIYLNAANVCPASRLVLDKHAEFLRDFHSNPSFQNRDKYVELRERLRGKLAGLLRVSADELAIVRNTSEGNNTIVHGLDLKPGDEVLITDHNHPSNRDSWMVRSKRDGFAVKAVPVSVPARSVADLLAGIEGAITSRTKVISFTHLTSTTGILYPARQICDLARRRGIYAHVDGAQTFGALDVNLREMGCDSYATSAHKWPMGPLEAGILYVRSERLPQVWPAIVTAGWADDLKGARKLEVFGQRDDPRIVALEPAMDLLSTIGLANIESRMRSLAADAKQQLKSTSRVHLLTNVEPELSAGVVKFRLDGIPTKRAYDTLWEKNRLAIAMTPSGDSEGLRFSPHIYNSRDDIARAVSAVKNLLAKG